VGRWEGGKVGRFKSSKVQKIRGSEVQRFRGSMDQRFRGSEVHIEGLKLNQNFVRNEYNAKFT